jgi:hypothetical protein
MESKTNAQPYSINWSPRWGRMKVFKFEILYEKENTKLVICLTFLPKRVDIQIFNFLPRPRCLS